MGGRGECEIARSNFVYAESMLIVAILILGLLVGSFLATVAARVAPAESWVWGRSRCRDCRMALGIPDLVPVLSWLVLRGRCRHCGAPISLLYPMVELACLAVGLWAVLVAPTSEILVFSLGLGWMLVLLGAIDMLAYRLPNLLTLGLGLAGVAVIATIAPDRLILHLVAAFGGYAVMSVTDYIYRRWRGREGLGAGDAKLFAAAGFWVGPMGLASVLLIGALSGLLFVAIRHGRHSDALGTIPVPFGPFLALGLWITWLHGPLVVRLAG